MHMHCLLLGGLIAQFFKCLARLATRNWAVNYAPWWVLLDQGTCQTTCWSYRKVARQSLASGWLHGLSCHDDLRGPVAQVLIPWHQVRFGQQVLSIAVFQTPYGPWLLTPRHCSHRPARGASLPGDGHWPLSHLPVGLRICSYSHGDGPHSLWRVWINNYQWWWSAHLASPRRAGNMVCTGKAGRSTWNCNVLHIVWHMSFGHYLCDAQWKATIAQDNDENAKHDRSPSYW